MPGQRSCHDHPDREANGCGAGPVREFCSPLQCIFIPLSPNFRITGTEVPTMSLISEFKDFLYEYKVIGLAIAFIIGVAATQLIQSLVNNILMPIITFFIPGGDWQSATLTLGPIVISWGKFLADLIYFIIIALVVFIVAKKVLKEEKVTKK
jgi:large conductance mechanosensitive channel